MSRNGKLTFLFLLFISALLISPVRAEDGKKKPLEEINYNISVGYYHYNVTGYHGKVGEYETLDTGMQSDFNIQGMRGRNYFAIDGNILDKRDESYTLDLDLKRRLQSMLSYRRFRHYLDHDPLENQDSHKDYDVSEDNVILIEEFKADNTFYIPSLPFLKFKADYRNYAKRGHRQATTVSKCAYCHVSSRNQRINSDTDDLHLGVETTLGRVLLQYEHFWRHYRQKASPAMNNYGRGASFFSVTGEAPYSRIPDSRMGVDKIRLSCRMPFDASLYADYQWGKKKNTDTHNRVRFNSFAGSLFKRLTRKISTRVYYNNYHMDNNSPNGFERDIERGGLNINTRILQQAILRGVYQWENIDRNNYNEGSTRKRTYRLTFNQRVSRRLRMNLKYKIVRTDDPFITEDNDFSDLVQTMQPEKEQDFSASINWTPRSNFSLTSGFRYFKGKYSRYNLDEDRYEYSISYWYVPFEKLTLTGSFSFFKNKTDTAGSYKTYHMRGWQSIVRFDNIPYNDRSRVFSLQAAYQFSPRFSMSGSLNYIRSRSDFDSDLDGKNIGSFSDLKIHEVSTSAGVTYICSKNMSIYAKYQFRDYNDREADYNDGQYSLVAAGINWSY